MEEDRLLELLLQDTDAEISQADRLELDRWLQQSPANRQMADQIRQYWKLSGQGNSDISIDIEKDYQIVLDKIKKKKKLSIGRIWALAASILLLIGLWFVYPYFSSGRMVQYMGPIKGITLRDGSKLDLEENSQFDFSINKESRKGNLTGRGYFVVQPGDKPFSISTKVGHVTVVGTSFAIDATASDRLIVAVEEGKVILKDYNDHSLEINSGEEGSITNSGVQKDFLQQPPGFWKLTPKEFTQTPFAEIIPQLEAYYHIKFTLNQPAIADCKVNFTLSFPPLDELFAILETLLNINIEKIADTQYLIKGSGCS